MQSSLSNHDIENFWIRVYLGTTDNLIDASIHRAYRDFNRTQHGIANLTNLEKYSILKQSMGYIVDQLLSKTFYTQDEFDEWHELSCDYLIDIYKSTIGYSLYVGQAQKWINMTFKYLYALGEKRVPEISNNYRWLHIPIDNIIQLKLKDKGIPQLKVAWSRIPTYDVYLEYQKRVRALPESQIPMDLEFELFNQA